MITLLLLIAAQSSYLSRQSQHGLTTCEQPIGTVTVTRRYGPNDWQRKLPSDPAEMVAETLAKTRCWTVVSDSGEFRVDVGLEEASASEINSRRSANSSLIGGLLGGSGSSGGIGGILGSAIRGNSSRPSSISLRLYHSDQVLFPVNNQAPIGLLSEATNLSEAELGPLGQAYLRSEKSARAGVFAVQQVDELSSRAEAWNNRYGKNAARVAETFTFGPQVQKQYSGKPDYTGLLACMKSILINEFGGKAASIQVQRITLGTYSTQNRFGVTSKNPVARGDAVVKYSGAREENYTVSCQPSGLPGVWAKTSFDLVPK